MRRLLACTTIVAGLAPIFGGVVTVCAQVVAPPGAAPQTSEEQSDTSAADASGLVLADRQWLTNLRLAKRLVEQGSFTDAVLVLQDLLDRASPGDGVPGEIIDSTVLRSLPAEVEAVLEALPPAGREAYRAKFAAEAEQLLEAALIASDMEQVKAVAQRFFHAPAGRQAALLMADEHLDQGRPFAAALTFDRVRLADDLTDEDRQTATVKAAVAWLRCGQSQEALQRLQKLKDVSERGEVSLPGIQVAPFTDPVQALNWLRQNLAADARHVEAQVGDWTIAGGDAARCGAGRGPAPGDKADWSDLTCRWQGDEDAKLFFTGGKVDLTRQISALQAEAAKRERRTLPACLPIVVGELVVARSLNGLRAYDRATGQLKWESSNYGRIIEDMLSGTTPPPQGARGSMLDPLLRQRVFTDGTFGAISSDGRLVFSIEELGVSPEQEQSVQRRLRIIQSGGANAAAANSDGKNDNRLAAHDAVSGKITWRAGDAPPLAGHYFLGAPLPVAGGLFVLAEQERTVKLLALDPATGGLEWSLDIDRAGGPVAQDHLRGQAGLSPSYRDGLFVCPSGVGKVVAVDPAARRIAWRYQYRKYDDTDPNNQQVMIRVMALNGRVPEEQRPVGQWCDSHAILTGQRVLLTPRDSEELHCLDLAGGKLLWKLPRSERLYVGGVFSDCAVLVGTKSVDLINLGNGELVRSTSATLPAPAGRGVLVGGTYHLPLVSGQIAEIDLETCAVKRRPVAEGAPLGNLVSAGKAVVSQSFDRVAALKPATP